MNSYMYTKYVQCKYILIIRDVPHVIHSKRLQYASSISGPPNTTK